MTRHQQYLLGGGAIVAILVIAGIGHIPHAIKRSSAPDAPLPTPVVEAVHTMTYHALTLSTISPAKELAAAVGTSNVDTVLKLNRIDSDHLVKNMTLTIPDSFVDFLAYAPFPPLLPDADTVPKLMVVSQRIQAFGIYENGTLVRWGPTSTGKQSTPTPSKLYFTNWKGKKVVSSIDDGWILPWYFNLDNIEGISMHQYELPGIPASHSCIRLTQDDAKWIYDWADQWQLTSDQSTVAHYGTPVLIFGQYAYGKTRPWKMLPNKPSATTVTLDELAPALSDAFPTIAARAQK